MQMPEPVADRAARSRIETDLGSTLVVEAGAGSGKTSELVGRVVALVVSRDTELSRIAAITFTEKAAAELRDRIRSQLEERATEQPGRDAEGLCRQALMQLDAAAIGTLHSFARRILNEHPIEAGLPPKIEVLDEVSSNVAFDQRWSMFQDEILSDRSLERTLLLLFACGVRPAALRHLAQVFEDNWDLVEEQVAETFEEPPSVRMLFEPVHRALAELLDGLCEDPEDGLRKRIEEIAERLQEVSSIKDEAELLEALNPDSEPKLPSFSVGNCGRAGAWDDITAVRDKVAELRTELDSIRQAVAEAATRRLASEIRRFTLTSAHERRKSGQLVFHDLLVLARALLRDPDYGSEVRGQLSRRYQRLLLDEFQDTDPIQIEIAVRIAAAEPESKAAGSLPWDEVPVAPGRLFIVGDPKQSIYRFRRADVSVFLRAAELLGRQDGRVELTANFRTVEPIIDWVNSTFAKLMGEPEEADLPVPSQPEYIALQATRTGPETGPAVSVVGRAEHPSDVKADEVRTLEAADVAAAVARILEERWTIHERESSRPAALGDMTILVPARTSLPFLEDALEQAGIPFRTESTSLVYASRPVRDLLMVLRAVDDPTNHLAIVSSLRTPLLGCGDDDLLRFRQERRGRWSYLADQPETVPQDDPVLRALSYLRGLYDGRTWEVPSELLERVARERRALELGTVQGRARDVWRRLRFVIDQARAWSGATGGNLRHYLAWVAQQAAEGGRIAEAVLPETDDDAVQIMTIHAAKGLEFPITILSGMSTTPQNRSLPAEVVFPSSGDVGYRFWGKVTTQEYENWKPVDEQMGLHERIRLLYVACTRARDHLVVSLHRKGRAAAPAPHRRTNAELLLDGMGTRVDDLPSTAEQTGEVRAPPLKAPSPPPPFEEWAAEREQALARASLGRTVAATALTDEGAPEPESEPDPGLDKRPRNLDLPPWLKGRYGSSVGRAVHGVLQSIDLSSGDGLAAAVAAQCEAEAVERQEDVSGLVTAALGARSVREAAASEHWREVYVCTEVGGRLLEGYIDLLYRTEQGLVVVDYKTSSSSEPTELDRRLESYRNQGASYALAVEAVAAETVVRVTFLFLTPQGAFERDLEGLDPAVAHVRQLVSSGREVTAI
jgi:ATP-dependent exoDNAse (exonuclease V) beta subunit